MPIDFKEIAVPSILAREFMALDAVRYVSVRGSDSFDGLSPGQAKRTMMAAYADLPSYGGMLLGGPGQFDIDPLLLTKFPVLIVGCGSGNLTGLATNPSQTILKLLPHSNASAIIAPKLSNGIFLQHLSIDGNKANQSGTSHGVEAVASTSATIAAENHDAWLKLQDVYIHDCLTDGAFFGQGHRACNIDRSYVELCGRHGVSMWSSDGYVGRVIVGSNGQYGVYIRGSANVVGYGAGIFGNLVNVVFEGDLGDGFGVSYNNQIVGAQSIDRALQHGVWVKNGAFDTAVTSSLFNGNGQQAANTYSQYKLDDTSTRHLVGGCTFYDDTGAVHPKYDFELAGGLFVSPNVHTGSFVTAKVNDGTKLLYDFLVPRITVTGSKGGNVALTNLLNALAQYGIITDSTT